MPQSATLLELWTSCLKLFTTISKISLDSEMFLIYSNTINLPNSESRVSNSADLQKYQKSGLLWKEIPS